MALVTVMSSATNPSFSTPHLTTSPFRRYTTPNAQHLSPNLTNTQASPPKMKLLYPTTLKLDTSPISSGFPTLTLHAYDAHAPTIDTALLDATVLVTWANSAANLRFAAAHMRQLRWIQSLAAGPNDVLGAGFDTSAIRITTGSGLHDRTVAEHALALLLGAARRLHEMRDCQRQGRWPGHLGGPQPDREPGTFRTLRDARVLIWGYGNIAKCLAPHLGLLGARVRGVARSEGVRNGVQVYGEEKLAELLPETDALVMILPGDASTRHALGKERLALLPKHAWVVNVGRGTSVDEDALYEALEEGSIGGAALDVFETEPLPEGSKLWKAPNMIVSPHAAGGRPQGAEELIIENLKRFLAEQELKNVI
ncbi:hypothetical protein BT67DRAFT_455776 [Trichocladium antarcticum]|uniref:D-isomer specific 2-hydroxyacid dehydrogenase NAD-binding domain-containing protein n=1 Tax=Trichocladium antarcticum TaxID=1450529 RepID=A0AAN6ULV6_9PEZI|nr:hypothetical protein BT67DRAFT_455776 [Trichocladium antarcticum]